MLIKCVKSMKLCMKVVLEELGLDEMAREKERRGGDVNAVSGKKQV